MTIKRCVPDMCTESTPNEALMQITPYHTTRVTSKRPSQEQVATRCSMGKLLPWSAAKPDKRASTKASDNTELQQPLKENANGLPQLTPTQPIPMSRRRVIYQNLHAKAVLLCEGAAKTGSDALQ